MSTVWKVDELFVNLLSNFDGSPNKRLVLLDAIFHPLGSSDLIHDVFPISEDPKQGEICSIEDGRKYLDY